MEVRGGKNDKDRVLTMPKSLVGLLEAQMQRCRVIHDKDREEGLAGVYLPGAYEVKNPAAGVGWPPPDRHVATWYLPWAHVR